MNAPTDINLYSVKADYEQGFKKGKLGLGGKVSYVESNNDFKRYDVDASDRQTRYYDTSRSNKFVYKENISAGYINYNRQFKGFMIQAGVRVENTHATGRSQGQKWEGSQGTWGQVPMPPNAAVPDADVRALVKWILSQ